MIKQIDDIIRDVRIAIDQNASSASLISEGDSDTLTLDEIIKSKIADSVKKVEMDAPTHLLDSGLNLGKDGVHWEENCSGWIILPEDFMRLLVFRMSDWTRSVYKPIGADDESYALQSSPYNGIRGNPQKPVCAIVLRAEGLVVEFYSCLSKEATIDQAVYLSVPKIENGGIHICEKCYSSIVYHIASLTEQSLGNVDAAKVFLDLSSSLLL